jgi:hypothetical protein
MGKNQNTWSHRTQIIYREIKIIFHHLGSLAFSRVFPPDWSFFDRKTSEALGTHRYNVVFKYLRQRSNGLKICLSAVFYIYPTVTSARSCNNVGHLFWFTILVQHETNDVILYIHIYSIHKHRGNTFQRQNYKMRLKQRSLNCINSMQVK